MANNFDNQFRSRSVQRSKRRKTNLILNSLIIIVVVLIIIVASNIFLGGRDDDKQASTVKNNETEHTSKKSESNNNKDEMKDNNKVADDEDDTGNEEDSSDEDEKQGLESDEVVIEDGNEPNVIKSYTNPNWKSVGTEQTNGHQYSSDMNSIDWKEKEAAMAYATGISVENMTIWFLERNGSDNEVVGTISPKDQATKTYRVYLSWVDGEGWKPTKVLELKENDKR